MSSNVKLKRTLGLPLIALYGLGNILGAGFTAFSYMELAGRYPVSASVSVYLHKAFGRRWLSVAVGLAMVGGGIASAAALSQGFAGYLGAFFSVPTAVASVGLLLLLGAIAIKGIGESARTAAFFTLIEILGLVLIIWFGRDAFAQIDPGTVLAIDPTVGVGGIIAGAFLAFYAFIGFEDMVNVSEEAKNPTKTMPIAILISLVVSTVLYLLVVLVATTLVKPSELAASSAPLTLVFERSGVSNAIALSLIGMVAAINGVIVQIIMGSRILYGLANQGWLPGTLATVHKTFNTPVTATLVILCLMIAGTLLLPLVSLAQLTSLLVLSIFTLVNASLVFIKRRGDQHAGFITVPMIVPVIGTVLCLGTILYQLYNWI